MKCHKCETKIKGTEKFCRKCGAKIEIKEVEHKKEEKSVEHVKEAEHKVVEHRKLHRIEPWHYPWIVIGILIIISTIILLPTKVVSYQVEVPYIDTEQYTVEVPFEDVEEYTVQVPYEAKEQYVESVPYTEEEEYIDIEYYTERVNTKDCDYNAGCGCISKHWFWGYCISCDCTKERPVTKYHTVTKYKDVIKERTVTNYKDETRYRKVTKTRTENREREVRKTRTETKQKEVNWLFGFNAIITFRNLG